MFISFHHQTSKNHKNFMDNPNWVGIFAFISISPLVFYRHDNKSCARLVLFWSNDFDHVCYLPMFCHFYSEILMLAPKCLKFNIHDLDSFLVILVYGLLILHFWIERYDVIFMSVTMYVILGFVQLLEFCFHVY